jgi:nickel-dependent lactate racemase
MVEIWLPYGATEVSARIPDENLQAIVEPKAGRGMDDPLGEVAKALDNPLGRSLAELIRPDSKVAVVLDDFVDASGSNPVVHPLINVLNTAGAKNEAITVILGRGRHGSQSTQDSTKLPGKIPEGVRVIHHSGAVEDLIHMGETSRKTKVYLNKAFLEASVRVVANDVCLHPYAGYSGGRKGVAPGLLGEESIMQNHSLMLSPEAAPGRLTGNPVSEDMDEIARMARIDFGVNVVANPMKEVVGVFAGDPEPAFAQAVKLVDELYKVPVEGEADIVLESAGGLPYDSSLSMAVSALQSALGAVSQHGAIILVAECSRGYGEEGFYRWMTKHKTLGEMEKELRRRFELDAIPAYTLMRASEKARIFLVSVLPSYYSTGVFGLRAEKTANDALRSALRQVGKRGKVLFLPHGSTTMPVPQK